MTAKRIRHAQFQFYLEQSYTDPQSGEDKVRLIPRIVRRGTVVDIPREEDVKRGESMGAFDEEQPPSDEELASRSSWSESEPDGDDEGPADLSDEDFRSHDKLVTWIRDERPKAAEVVAAAGDDPDKAEALMEAENEASGGDPRKTVVERLQKIIDQEE
jgi:hypothetical protein